MSYETKLYCAIILFLIPTIEFGGHFLLQTKLGKHKDLDLTTFQKEMFRSGHAHAGVLSILALVAQILIDQVEANSYTWILRVGFILSAVVMSAGFFLSALGQQRTSANYWIRLIYAAMLMLTTCLITLGILLLK